MNTVQTGEPTPTLSLDSTSTSNEQTLELSLSLKRPSFEMNLELSLPLQGISVLFGPSGSGKTSLLRCVAGLEPTSQGRVVLGGLTLQDTARGLCRPPYQRPMGYVFQEASLFDHLDVLGNLKYGLKPQRLNNKAASNERIQPRLSPQEALRQAIEILGLSGLLDRPTQQLSGGERQRVAIARALATQPQMLLLDEPLAALDRARTQEILPWLEKLRDELHLPMLYVTHSETEMTRLATTLVLLERGQLKAVGPIQSIFANASWLTDLGQEPSALLPAQISERDLDWGLAKAQFNTGGVWFRDPGLPTGSRVRLRILARDVSIALSEPQLTSIQNILPAQVLWIQSDAHPSQSLVRLQTHGLPLWAKVTTRAVHTLGLQAGQHVWAQLKSVALVE
jgi:molybdate transport system ATP-binding protein